MKPHSGQCTAGALLDVAFGDALAREDVRELLDVGAGEHGLALLVLLAQPVDELGAENVDLAVQDAAVVGDLLLLLSQLLDEVLELLVGERAEVWEGVQDGSVLSRVRAGLASIERAVKLSLRLSPPRAADVLHLARRGRLPQASWPDRGRAAPRAPRNPRTERRRRPSSWAIPPSARAC